MIPPAGTPRFWSRCRDRPATSFRSIDGADAGEAAQRRQFNPIATGKTAQCVHLVDVLGDGACTRGGPELNLVERCGDRLLPDDPMLEALLLAPGKAIIPARLTRGVRRRQSVTFAPLGLSPGMSWVLDLLSAAGCLYPGPTRQQPRSAAGSPFR